MPGVGQQLAVVPQPCCSVWVLRNQHLRHTLLRGAVAAHVLFGFPGLRLSIDSLELMLHPVEFQVFSRLREVHTYSPPSPRGGQGRGISTVQATDGYLHRVFRAGNCLFLTGRRRDLGDLVPKKDSQQLVGDVCV